jgi:hypothetical protein
MYTQGLTTTIYPNLKNHSALGIPVVASVPSVGKGLKDHLLAPVCGFSRVNMR